MSLQDLGEKLLHLTEKELKDLELPENIFDAVMLGRAIKKHGALKRQVQYIGALMRKVDPKPIEAAVRSREEMDREQADLHKRVEARRNELIRGNDELREELMQTMPEQEKSRFAALVESARGEAVKQKPNPAASRMLFRFLHAIAKEHKR